MSFPLEESCLYSLQGIPDQNHISTPLNKEKTPWLGRIVSSLWMSREVASHITSKIKKVGFELFSVLNVIANDPDLMIHVFGKMQGQILPYIELKRGQPDHFHPLKKVMRSGVDMFTSLQVATSADYFMNSKFKGDHPLYISAHAFLFAARIGVCSRWLLEIGLVNFGRIACSMGKSQVFCVLAKTSSVLFGLANIFFAADALDHIFHAKTEAVLYHGLFELGKNLAEFGLNATALFGVVHPAFLCALGCASAVFGISSVFYKQQKKSELTYACRQSIQLV